MLRLTEGASVEDKASCQKPFLTWELLLSMLFFAGKIDKDGSKCFSYKNFFRDMKNDLVLFFQSGEKIMDLFFII